LARKILPFPLLCSLFPFDGKGILDEGEGNWKESFVEQIQIDLGSYLIGGLICTAVSW